MSVERTGRSPVLDLSRPGAVGVEIDVSEAAELLMSMCTLSGEEEFDTFDLGRERLEAIRADAPRDLLASLDDLLMGSERVPAHLLGLVYSTPKPRTVDAFVARLERTEPIEVQLHLLGYYMRGHHLTAPETMHAAASGQAGARDELLDAISEWSEKRRGVERLLDLGAKAVKGRLLELIPRWQTHVFAPLADEAMRLAEEDARLKRERALSLSPEQLVELTTSGYQYTPTPDVRKLVFFPTYWQRPWVVLIDYKHVRIFSYPIAVDREGLDGPTPTQLARMYKALGDEGRLRLLKRLGGGPLTLADAADELGVAKSTAHHHLAILRHAGFVLVREDEDKVYDLRRDLLPQAGALLETFLAS